MVTGREGAHSPTQPSIDISLVCSPSPHTFPPHTFGYFSPDRTQQAKLIDIPDTLCGFEARVHTLGPHAFVTMSPAAART